MTNPTEAYHTGNTPTIASITCSQAHPCDNPNHNHTGYRMPPYTPVWPETKRHIAAHDARITIGAAIKQDNGEYEYPGYIDGALIAFYRNIREADLALRNILAAEMPATFGVVDVEFAPVGWAD